MNWARYWMGALALVARASIASVSLAASNAPEPEAAGLSLKFQVLSESQVSIAGRSTLGAWEADTRDIIAQIEPGEKLAALAARVSHGVAPPAGCRERKWQESVSDTLNPPHALITIPVASLRCDKPGMRTDLLRTLRAEESPLIVFLLTAISRVDVQPPGPADLGKYRVTARGDLILAGKSRPIEITSDVVQHAPTRFGIRAKKSLHMSDFGIAAPTALFGLIRADDEVVVSFDLMFEAIVR